MGKPDKLCQQDSEKKNKEPKIQIKARSQNF